MQKGTLYICHRFICISIYIYIGHIHYILYTVYVYFAKMCFKLWWPVRKNGLAYLGTQCYQVGLSFVFRYSSCYICNKVLEIFLRDFSPC